MAGDGVLSIGATVDKTGVEAGLESIKGSTQAVVQSIAVQVEETVARTKSAWNKLGADVKTAAESVSAEALKMAEATKVQTAAMADLRRASVIARDTNISEAESTAILAAAQTKAAAAAAGVAAAKQAEAEAIATANAEAQLSENALIATFQRSGIAIRESLTAVQEKLIQTAETGQLSAQGISSGFGGLGALLGAGLAVGFGAHFLDELAKMNVELDHLSVSTGISITSLAGLQQIAKEMGSEWDPIATGLTRMNKNLNDSVPPTKQLTAALAGVNLKIADLKGLSPEEKLDKIAEAFAGTTNSANRTAAAYALFGRGGVALIPILTEQGAQLDANIKKQGALTGVTEETAEAARRWTADMAKLTAQFRSVMMPVMEHAEDVIRGVAVAFETAAAIIVSAFEGIATAIVATYAPFARLAVLLKDVFTGNWAAIKSDAESMTGAFTDTWKKGFAEIRSNWREVYHTLTDQTQIPRVAEFAGGDGDDPATKPKKGKGAAGGALGAAEAALNELKLNHEVTLEEELSFWQQRLAAARKGTDEYKAILAKIAPLMQRELKKPQDKGDQRSVDLSGVTIPQGELDAAVKANSNAVRQTVEDDRAGAEEKMRIAAEDYQDVVRNTAFEVQMGRMSSTERIQALRVAAAEERRIREQQSQFIQMLDMNDLRRYRRDLQQQEQATRQWARTIQQLNQQAALDASSGWRRAYDQMSQVFSQNLSMWISGQQSLSQSWSRTLQGITQAVVQNLARQAIAYATNAATQDAIDQRQKLKDAAAAARGAFKAVVGIPIVGPFLAPVAAAAAFAAVEAFEAGGVVGGQRGMGVPILAHAGERVLTPTQTENFHKMVNQSNSSSSSSSTTHLHLQQNVNAYDRTGMRSTLKAHADDLLDIVQGGIRSGRLKPA